MRSTYQIYRWTPSRRPEPGQVETGGMQRCDWASPITADSDEEADARAKAYGKNFFAVEVGNPNVIPNLA